MKFVVTGGAGFIGSNIVRGLISEGQKVKVIDNLSTGKASNIGDVRDSIDFVNGDARDPELLKKEFAGQDFVLHLAGLPSVVESVQDPLRSHDINVNSTIAVLEAARAAKVRRVVFASSAAIYGDQEAEAHVETLSPKPLSPYALQKLQAEQYMKMYSDLFGLDTVSLRYFNIFGPFQDPKSPYSGVISLFIDAFRSGKRPVIFGDGTQTRDFCYVGDVVRANLLACKAKVLRGAVINIGTGKPTSVLELHSHLQEITGRPLEPAMEPSRPGEILHSLADISRARELLDFVPTNEFRHGLKMTVEHMDKKN